MYRALAVRGEGTVTLRWRRKRYVNVDVAVFGAPEDEAEPALADTVNDQITAALLHGGLGLEGDFTVEVVEVTVDEFDIGEDE